MVSNASHFADTETIEVTDRPNPPPTWFTPPQFSDGALEVAKWIALVTMTVDHVNKYLLHGSVPAMFAIGRIAMPLFSFVLAVNLARPVFAGQGGEAFHRTLLRLVASGGIATPFFIALGGLGWGWWPLNIMFTLATAVGALYLGRRGGALGQVGAAGLVLVGGAFVESWWPAVGMTLAAWFFVRRPSWISGFSWVAAALACSALTTLAGGIPLTETAPWSLIALPAFLWITAVFADIHLPRLRLFFYVYFPLHLAVLLGIRHAL